MKLIGVLGGVASGKSAVAQTLAEFGAAILDADSMGHEVLRTPEVEQAARQRWGDAIFGPDGHIDRSRLARIVFGASASAAEQRNYLEQLVHPEVARRVQREMERLDAAGHRAAVLDAPLLMEAGWDRLCAWLIFVDAPRPLRLARALARGWSETDFAAREGVQESLDCKRRRADVVVDNSGPPEATRAQLEQFWRLHIGDLPPSTRFPP